MSNREMPLASTYWAIIPFVLAQVGQFMSQTEEAGEAKEKM